jgi:predicted RNase H-related nuclease YkuK (DUF458 family)
MLSDQSHKRDFFTSPTRGKLSFDSVVYDLVDFMETFPKDKYVIVVGTDSKLYNGESLFVTVIFIHRVGKGARYFYQKSRERIGNQLRPRIYEEANLSLELGQKLIERLQGALKDEKLNYDFEIHVDIGKGGPTKEMIREIVGMIEGNGFVARYKPDSYGASIVADKHT